MCNKGADVHVRGGWYYITIIISGETPQRGWNIDVCTHGIGVTINIDVCT